MPWRVVLPYFELHCPLMRLPLVLGTTVDTIAERRRPPAFVRREALQLSRGHIYLFSILALSRRLFT